MYDYKSTLLQKGLNDKHKKGYRGEKMNFFNTEYVHPSTLS